MTTHSDKATQTMKMMGVVPTALKLTTIRWEKAMRMVRGEVECPSCKGLKWVRFDAAGAVIPAPAREKTYAYPSPRAEYEKTARAEHAAKHGQAGFYTYTNCPTCRETNTRSRNRGNATGKVPGMVLREVMVGTPVFPAGAKFTSRYGASGCHCHLCGKNIPSNRFVPVDDGAAHAMWVGEDCAAKILAVASPFKVKASELERVIQK